MSWVKLDDHANEHRKQVAAGPAACWLWACGLMYANRQPARDGFIPAGVVPMLFEGASKKLAAKLVEVGLWEAIDGGYRVHDYHDFQPTTEVADERKTRRIERAKKGAKARWSNAPSNASSMLPSIVADASKHPRDGAPSNASSMLADAPDPDPDPDPDPQEIVENAREARSAMTTPVGEQAKTKAKRTKTPELPIPEDWTPPESFWIWAEKKRYSREDCERCIEALSLWARSKNVRRADWTAALQGWVNREAADGKVSLAPLKQPSHGVSLPRGEPMPVSEVSEMLLAGLARLEGSQAAGTAIDFSGLEDRKP